MNLSKSKYCKGLQCPKMLWLDKHKPDAKDPVPANETVFKLSNEVGDLAMGYFGKYTEVKFDENDKHNIQKMVDTTAGLLAGGTNIITEASFSCAGLFCSVDILKATQDGGYEIIEVKSSSASIIDRPEDIEKNHAIYLDDMAFQAYVLQKCGIPVKKVLLMQLNRDYARKGDLDIYKLFVLTDCTRLVFQMQADIATNIAAIEEVVSKPEEPFCEIGSRCDKPYTCAYKGHCFRHLPRGENVFEIGWGMQSRTKDKLYHDGLITFAQVEEKLLETPDEKRSDKTNQQLRQLRHSLQKRKQPHIDIAALNSFLRTVRYPLYFLDFETFSYPIPRWDEVKPGTKIPFQYSLHIKRAQDQCLIEETDHKEFLAREGTDPRRAIAESLVANIPADACVMAYNMDFEKGRLFELATLFKDLKEHLLAIRNNMIDLKTPFQKGWFYCHEMGGSYSIKAVLPALFPNDEELDYHKLDVLVQNGGDAMNIFPDLHLRPQDEIEQVRKALLAYCRLDTLAMVRILEKLYQLNSIRA